MQDRFRVVGVRDVAADSKDVSTFFYVVLEVVVGTLVRELGHFNPAKRKCQTYLKSAITYFSEANYSSRSYKSRLGGGRSFMHGRKTAACS